MFCSTINKIIQNRPLCICGLAEPLIQFQLIKIQNTAQNQQIQKVKRRPVIVKLFKLMLIRMIDSTVENKNWYICIIWNTDIYSRDGKDNQLLLIRKIFSSLSIMKFKYFYWTDTSFTSHGLKTRVLSIAWYSCVVCKTKLTLTQLRWVTSINHTHTTQQLPLTDAYRAWWCRCTVLHLGTVQLTTHHHS